MTGIDSLPHCPKCGALMAYLVEKEKNGKGEIRITRYYRCPVCGTKVIDERILVKPVDGKIQVFSLTNGKRQIIYSVRKPLRVIRSRRGTHPRRK
jgi:DNA-directed RNA polymerase subunit RPC12/RpoP